MAIEMKRGAVIVGRLGPRNTGEIPHVSLPSGITGDPRVLMIQQPIAALQAAKTAYSVLHLEQGVPFTSVILTRERMDGEMSVIGERAEKGDGKARKAGVALLERASTRYNTTIPDQRWYGSEEPITIYRSGEIKIKDTTQP